MHSYSHNDDDVDDDCRYIKVTATTRNWDNDVRVIIVPSRLDSVAESIMFLGCSVLPSVRPFIRSSGQILLPRYLVNGLNNFAKTDKEYLPAPIDDVLIFGRSKVTIAAGCGVQILCTPYLVNDTWAYSMKLTGINAIPH